MLRSFVVLALLAAPASAYWSASRGSSLYVNRYLVCDDKRAVDDGRTPGGSAAEGRRGPIDDGRCVGAAEAKRALHAALVVGTLAPGTNHDREVDGAIDAMVTMIHANDRDALPAIRKLLAIRVEPADRNEHTMLDKNALRAEAANALAQLGDASSAQAIEDLVTEFETDGHGTLWLDTLGALAVLDPARASRYAIRFLDRTSNFRMSMPGGSDKLHALDYVRDADALPVLERLATAEENGYDPAYCAFQAARVRLDPKLHAKVRDMFAGHYSGSWLAGCDTTVMKAFGSDPADAAVLVRHFGRDDAGLDYGMTNVAYPRALELIASGKLDAKATAILTAGLAEQAKYPHIADPTNERYSLHFVAYNAAAQAGLGDATARDRLYAIIDDDRERTGTAWLAAYWAIRLRLPGAADHAGALMVRGLAYGNDTRNGVFEDLRVKVVDAYADAFPDDPRWAIALLSPQGYGGEGNAAERAMYRLGRHAPPNVCATVTAAAAHANQDATEFGLLALTELGATCLPELEKLADTGEVELRGLALEFVSALESPDLCAHLAAAARDGVPEHYVTWARSLRATRCNNRHGDQPLPPRVQRQDY